MAKEPKFILIDWAVDPFKHQDSLDATAGNGA